jgi:hypothetical protein
MEQKAQWETLRAPAGTVFEKNSYAEIMARAKAVMDSPLGRNPVEYINAPYKKKEEIESEKAEQRTRWERHRSESFERKKKREAAEKKKAEAEKKKAELAAEAAAYKGTQSLVPTHKEARREKPLSGSTYKGSSALARAKMLSSKPSSTASSRLSSPSSSSRKPLAKQLATKPPPPQQQQQRAKKQVVARRRSDTPDSYHSDSSDMEAGMTDIDAEERAAERAARAEDLAAQREEEAHRRRKEERKRALGRK